MGDPTTGVLRILIVHFNTPELTTALLGDIPLRTPHGREIAVHIRDNSSSPQNILKLQEGVAGSPHCTLTFGSNIGYGEALNELVAQEGVRDEDILWVLNPDTRISARCIEFLEREINARNFEVISPLVYSGYTGAFWIWYCGGSLSTRDFRVEHHYYGCPVEASPPTAFETEFITGAAPMMSVATFRAVGGFPPGYFLYWEDVFFSWKAQFLGYHLGVVPEARIWHSVGAASGSSQSSTYYYWSTRNRFVFARDVGVSRWQLVAGIAGIETLRPFARALLREKQGRFAKAEAAIRGTIAGFREAKKKSRGPAASHNH